MPINNSWLIPGSKYLSQGPHLVPNGIQHVHLVDQDLQDRYLHRLIILLCKKLLCNFRRIILFIYLFMYFYSFNHTFVFLSFFLPSFIFIYLFIYSFIFIYIYFIYTLIDWLIYLFILFASRVRARTVQIWAEKSRTYSRHGIYITQYLRESMQNCHK